ncbi:NAD-dependent epimerase/dehydratase family protein [Microbacterium sp. 18062]|uniref:NAD-dependent epimerase/dehydratase family protein n=1 Tax=Microbacterium sp. 18062 TaxID=2681410 RepID=UPI00135BA3B3|nr:NAD-dependent epimerase/dehydratase family protein [Microbacterium sp. 18062]
MSRPRAVIAGASGFVGRALVEAFEQDGYDIRTIRRTGPLTWSEPDRIRASIDGAEVLLNLAGMSVNRRYNDRNRDEILRSRIETTRMLRQAVASAASPPRLWLNASTATIYRHSTDRPNTEATGELGTGFSVDVARAWEHELFAGDLPAMRRVALRMTIVLGDGPATGLLLRLARLGLGGPQIDGWWPLPHRRYRGIGPHPTGDGRASGHRTRGRQRFSWIHIDDVVGAVRFLREDDAIDGPVNLSSPNPTDNRTLMSTLRRVVGMPIGLPAWRWMLEPAMWALRTQPWSSPETAWYS